MNKRVIEFLQFEGEQVLFTFKNGEFYIAIKPLCIALGVNYKHQNTILNKDVIFKAESRNFGIQVPDDQIRKFVCLPEYLIYAWLLQINSNDEKLIEYKRECSKALHDYFRGSILNRDSLETEKAKTIVEIRTYENKLTPNKDYIKLLELNDKLNKIKYALSRQDRNNLDDKINLWDQDFVA